MPMLLALERLTPMLACGVWSSGNVQGLMLSVASIALGLHAAEPGLAGLALGRSRSGRW